MQVKGLHLTQQDLFMIDFVLPAITSQRVDCDEFTHVHALAASPSHTSDRTADVTQEIYFPDWLTLIWASARYPALPAPLARACFGSRELTFNAGSDVSRAKRCPGPPDQRAQVGY